MLSHITPLVLTFNEARNVGRMLDRLAWARRIVILDSCSDDDTESIVRKYSNADFFRRPFDNHASQWNFGLLETGIDTEWVLALDADYILPEAFVEELRTLDPAASTAGYSASFRYCVEGIPLRGTVYTPVTVLFRRNKAKYVQKGHTQRVQVSGSVGAIRSPINHDDRKPLNRWFAAQVRYMELEAEVILSTPEG